MSVPVAYIGIILIWSTTPLVIQWSGDGVGYLFGITSRMILGVVVGLGLFFAMTSVYWSSQFIPSGWISVLFGLAPVVTGLIATVWLTEQTLNAARIVGMLLGLAGLAIMSLGSQQPGPQATWGIPGMVFSVIAYTVSAVAVKRIGADIPALATTIGGLMVTIPLLVFVYLLVRVCRLCCVRPYRFIRWLAVIAVIDRGVR